MKKEVFVTHADVDHCGLLPDFDTVYASAETAECLRMEYADGDGYREKNPLHKPYIQICKIFHVVYPRRSGEGRDGRRGSDGGERR